MASIEELKRELAKERAKQNVLFNFKERELERMKLKRELFNLKHSKAIGIAKTFGRGAKLISKDVGRGVKAMAKDAGKAINKQQKKSSQRRK